MERVYNLSSGKGLTYTVLYKLTGRLLCVAQGPFADYVNQDQKVHKMQSDLALHCPIRRYFQREKKKVLFFFNVKIWVCTIA